MDSLRRKAPSERIPPAPPFLPRVPLANREIFDVPNPSSPPSLSQKFPPTENRAPVRSRPSNGWLYGVYILGFSLVALGIFVIGKGFYTAEKIQIRGNAAGAPTLAQKLKTLQAVLLPGELTPLKGAERGRINILLLGRAGKGFPGENLTDTLMLASINTKSQKVALLSLPRDLYVEGSAKNPGGKINTFYQRGKKEDEPLTLIKEAVTTVTGQPVDYFFVMDFTGFEQIVDALGGITVEVPKDFYDPRYPGKNYSYELFELKKGWQRLDGPTALKYVRERHDDPEGDFGRAKRQQQVLQAIKNKAASPGTYLNFFKINRLFKSVADNVETDITLPEMQSFYELSKTLDTQNISNQVIDAWKPESLLRVDHHTLGGMRTFTLVPRTGNWEETRELAKNIFDLEALASRKAAIQEEGAVLLILDSGETLQSADKLARYIERELNIETIVEYAPQLKRENFPAMLYSRGTLEKPYSFDELLKRLPVTKGNEPSFSVARSEADFILTMDEKLARSFQNADEYYNPETAAESDFSESPSL